MAKIEVKKDIYWVGAVDWNVRTFHGHTYTTKRGTTYNAYLILDDKIVLVDNGKLIAYGPRDKMISAIAENKFLINTITSNYFTTRFKICQVPIFTFSLFVKSGSQTNLFPTTGIQLQTIFV
jgi:hypothetical protein